MKTKWRDKKELTYLIKKNMIILKFRIKGKSVNECICTTGTDFDLFHLKFQCIG